MPDDRLRVKKSSRKQLREAKRPDEQTYSDVLIRILPKDEDRKLQPEEKTAIPVTEEVSQKVESLAGENVPAYRVVEYYLHRYEVQNADELLDQLYNMGTDEETGE